MQKVGLHPLFGTKSSHLVICGARQRERRVGVLIWKIRHRAVRVNLSKKGLTHYKIHICVFQLYNACRTYTYLHCLC